MKQYYPSAGEIVLLPCDRIISGPCRDEDAYTETALSDLVLSIQTNGLLEPILVLAVDDSFYRIASGERRFRAAVMAGMAEIPCILVNDEHTAGGAPYALIGEMHHEPIHYLDQTAAIRKLMDEDGYNLFQLSQILSVSMRTLSEKLRLLDLSEDIRKMIKEKGVSEPVARILLTVEESKRREALERIIADDLSLTGAKTYIRSEKEKSRRDNIMIFKDLNVFINTVEHAVETMNRNGIASSVDRTETEEMITYTVTISKKG